jgi:hypothetical protein
MAADREGSEAERRWARRRGLELDADVTDAQGMSYAAKITDISEEGCSLRTLCGSDLVRELVHEIKVTGLDVINAYVIWSAEGRAGLSFATPLQSATVENLVMKSLYARLSRPVVNRRVTEDHFRPLGPFPFKG